MKQWEVHYKRFPGGVQHSLVEASSLLNAELVGKLWCEKKTREETGDGRRYQFLFVRDPIVADESILGYGSTVEIDEPVIPKAEQVSPDEQRRRIEANKATQRQVPVPEKGIFRQMVDDAKQAIGN